MVTTLDLVLFFELRVPEPKAETFYTSYFHCRSMVPVSPLIYSVQFENSVTNQIKFYELYKVDNTRINGHTTMVLFFKG